VFVELVPLARPLDCLLKDNGLSFISYLRY